MVNCMRLSLSAVVQTFKRLLLWTAHQASARQYQIEVAPLFQDADWTECDGGGSRCRSSAALQGDIDNEKADFKTIRQLMLIRNSGWLMAHVLAIIAYPIANNRTLRERIE